MTNDAREAFDMFGSAPPFSDRVAAVARKRRDLDVASILALLVTAISAEAVVVAEYILPRDEADKPGKIDSLRAMSDALKYVVMSAENFDEEDIEERIDTTLSVMPEEARAKMNEDVLGALHDAFGEIEGDEDMSETPDSEEIESSGSSDEDSTEDEDFEEDIVAEVEEAVKKWDEWNPTDPLLASLKSGFADSVENAVEEAVAEEKDEENF